MPKSYTKPINELTGKITTISSSYIVVQNHNKKIIVFTKDSFIIDSYINIKGLSKLLYKRPGFYNFDFTTYLNNQGIYYEIINYDIALLKEGTSFKAFLQKEINRLNIENKAWLYKLLVGLKTDEIIEDIFINSGFSFIGLILIIKSVLNKFFYKKKADTFELIFVVLLSFIYGFPLQLLRILIFNIIKKIKFNTNDRIGLSITLLLLIDSNQVFNMGFWILLSYYYSQLLFTSKSMHLLFILFLQGLFNKSFNIVLTLGYRIYIYFLGISYIFGLITIIIKLNFYDVFITTSNKIYKLIYIFNVKGYPIGFGLIFIISIYIYLRKNKHKWKFILVIYILMNKLSLIHILGEITFINIGQGDSILIRSSFNTTNILIDTGSKYQYRYLKQFLDSKGIYIIDALIITHYDEDHCGNIESLKEDFNVKSLVDQHFNELNINKINVYELNDNNYLNDNDNSLVNLIKINDLTFLFTGDISKEVELDIIEKYDLLEVDILKLAHHGSNTSTSKKFIKHINPKLSIISSGKNNLYRHPSKEVISLLKNEGHFYLNTKYSGDITIYFMKYFNLIYTSDKRIGIIYK